MEQEKKLTVTMLGGFHMYWGGEEFRIKSGDSTKAAHILQLLLYQSPERVTTAKMIQCIFAYDDILNPNNSLKASISLLRRQLDATPLPNVDYITFQDHSYVWNETLIPEVDAHVFEELVRKAEAAEGEEGIRLCREACAIYRGAFLPGLMGVDWAEMLNVYYGNLYSQIVRKLSELLRQFGQLEEALAVATEAYSRLPSDEWLVLQMHCLMDLGRWDDAKRVYMSAVSAMSRDYDVQPSAELQQQYRTISSHLSNPLGNFPDMLNDMREERNVGGGYFCTFPGFIDSSRITIRTMARSGLSCFMMLVSLSDASGMPIPSGAKLDEVSRRLQESIQNSLRRSDFFTQYNQSQYIIFLQGTNMENCKVVQRRIDASFRRVCGRDVRLQFECHTALLESLDELRNPAAVGWH